MNKFLASSATLAAALLFAGGALAASAQPQSGQEPFVDGAPADASTQTRSAVEAQAARTPPADGDFNAQGKAAPKSTLTREQVREQTQQAEKAAHGFPDKSGESK